MAQAGFHHIRGWGLGCDPCKETVVVHSKHRGYLKMQYVAILELYDFLKKDDVDALSPKQVYVGKSYSVFSTAKPSTLCNPYCYYP